MYIRWKFDLTRFDVFLLTGADLTGLVTCMAPAGLNPWAPYITAFWKKYTLLYNHWSQSVIVILEGLSQAVAKVALLQSLGMYIELYLPNIMVNFTLELLIFFLTSKP